MRMLVFLLYNKTATCTFCLYDLTYRFKTYESSQWVSCSNDVEKRCIDVTGVDTTLFRRCLTMTCPLGYLY